MGDTLLERLAGRRVVASISGGKDSAALGLYLRELGVEFDRVFFDVGWDEPSVYEHLRGPVTDALGPVTEIRAKVDPPPHEVVVRLRPRVRAAVEAGSAMVCLILKKGMFPSRTIRFCTQELKVFAMQAHLAGLIEAGHEVVNAVGIRRDESEARAAALEWERWEWGNDEKGRYDCDVWRPLVEWSVADVVAIHKRHGLSPAPLYLAGASRVGCWPCIHARKSEIRFIADRDPERIALIRELELDVADLARERRERDGKPVGNPPAFFQSPSGNRTDANGKVVHDGTCWPIDRVVKWSRTIRGGKEEDRQELLFASHNDGCMRWGMCETAPTESPTPHPPTAVQPDPEEST